MRIIFIIGLLALSILWGKLFVIGKRLLLPFKIQDLKEDLSGTVLAFSLCTCGFCCMFFTALGAIVLFSTIILM